MKKFIPATLLSAAIGGAPLIAQEKYDTPMKGPMPTKESMPMKGEGMQGMNRKNSGDAQQNDGYGKRYGRDDEE